MKNITCGKPHIQFHVCCFFFDIQQYSLSSIITASIHFADDTNLFGMVVISGQQNHIIKEFSKYQNILRHVYKWIIIES